MLLNGKKTERVLMRVSEEMSQQIRALAELEHRSVWRVPLLYQATSHTYSTVHNFRIGN